MSLPETGGSGGRRLLVLLPVLGFLVLVGFFALGLTRDPALLPSAMIDKPAPDFTLAALMTDKPGLARSDLGGKPALVNFFASWCVPCRAEHATLAGLAASGGVPLYGIDYKDKPADGQRFLDGLGDPYQRVGMDADGRTGIDFGVYGVPETYIVDAGGAIRYRWVGPLTPEALQDEILPRLAALKDK
ncbi:MAG TPA: DsbE family thiol:disulfide interchange protein [Aliidongia sp.]|nr:DsbE family thiol:disulfide interchange protein [Aliidongia sp.]